MFSLKSSSWEPPGSGQTVIYNFYLSGEAVITGSDFFCLKTFQTNTDKNEQQILIFLNCVDRLDYLFADEEKCLISELFFSWI